MVRDIGRSARLQADLAQPDAELLERFVGRRDEAAFEALLHRHGSLVFGVCRRLLVNPHDAADAFQATFLILARKAGSVGRRELLGNWLYGVAHRVAARARKNLLRQRSRERAGVDLAEVPDAERSLEPDLVLALHEEVRRLPDKYRGPVVLCYLEGKTGEEAARELNCPATTVKGRLSLAREMLRTRLARRGVTLTAGLLAASTLTTPAPAALLEGTIRAASSFAAGGAVAGGASAGALALTQGVIRSMLLSQLKLVAAAVLSVAVLAGAGGLAYHTLATEPPARDDKKADKPKDDADAILGSWHVVAVEQEGKEVKDRMKSSMVITREKIVSRVGDVERLIAYKLDPTTKPKAIDITYLDARATVPCVYALEGDTLKLCIPIAHKDDRPADKATREGGRGGHVRPTEVATREGSGTMLIVLRHAAEGKEQARDKPKQDKDLIQGTWKVAKVEAEGQDQSDKPREAKFFMQSTWTITEGKIVIKSESNIAEVQFKLDPSAKPKAIDCTMTAVPNKEIEGKTFKGIYSLEGNTLKIHLPNDAGANRPTELETQRGGMSMMLVLKRPVKDG